MDIVDGFREYRQRVSEMDSGQLEQHISDVSRNIGGYCVKYMLEAEARERGMGETYRYLMDRQCL